MAMMQGFPLTPTVLPGSSDFWAVSDGNRELDRLEDSCHRPSQEEMTQLLFRRIRAVEALENFLSSIIRDMRWKNIKRQLQRDN